MDAQKYRYHLAMAGEYFVAAQLQRLQVTASLTYGNAKSADVIAYEEGANGAIAVEVKTTQKSKWVVGRQALKPSGMPWVLVYLPSDDLASPEFYVMTQDELSSITLPAHEEYKRKFLEKHGVEFDDQKSVISVKLADVMPYRDRWQTLTNILSSKGMSEGVGESLEGQPL